VSPRKFDAIRAVLGSDATPAALCPGNATWMDLSVGSTTFTCSFSAAPPQPARKRLLGVAFAQQANPPPTCPSDSVRVGPVCVDTYEASVWSGPAGGTQYGATSDDYPCDDNGNDCTNIYARSVAGVLPSANITWFQAAAACRNAGKRLLSNQEWQMAALGSPQPTPGVDNGTTDCNTDSVLAAVPTGARSGCFSTVSGAFDMVGNVNEWVAEWVPRSTICVASAWGGFSDDFMCLAGASTTANAPGAIFRGGYWGPNAGVGNAGAFAVSGNDDLNASFAYIGFRCAR
jgi:formylglycine-generating enzyme required for sulfatase activity